MSFLWSTNRDRVTVLPGMWRTIIFGANLRFARYPVENGPTLQWERVHDRTEDSRVKRHVRNQGPQRQPACLREEATGQFRSKILVRVYKRRKARRNTRQGIGNPADLRNLRLAKPTRSSSIEEDHEIVRGGLVDGELIRPRDCQDKGQYLGARLLHSRHIRSTNRADP